VKTIQGRAVHSAATDEESIVINGFVSSLHIPFAVNHAAVNANYNGIRDASILMNFVVVKRPVRQSRPSSPQIRRVFKGAY
jgi:hypothetical protein